MLACLHSSGERQMPLGSAGADILLLQSISVMPWWMLCPQTNPDILPKSWHQHLGIYSASWTLPSVWLLGSLCRGAHEPACMNLQANSQGRAQPPFPFPCRSCQSSHPAPCPPGTACLSEVCKVVLAVGRSAEPPGREGGLGKCQLIIFSEREWCSGKRERAVRGSARACRIDTEIRGSSGCRSW